MEDPETLLFLFNTKQLKLDLTVEKAGFLNGETIYVIDAGKMKGGFLSNLYNQFQ